MMIRAATADDAVAIFERYRRVAAVPGGLAALGLAAERYGALDFAAVVAPAAAIAASGFPCPRPPTTI